MSSALERRAHWSLACDWGGPRMPAQSPLPARHQAIGWLPGKPIATCFRRTP